MKEDVKQPVTADPVIDANGQLHPNIIGNMEDLAVDDGNIAMMTSPEKSRSRSRSPMVPGIETRSVKRAK